MKYSVLAEVVKLEKESEYQKRPDGTSDYFKEKAIFTQTTMEILKNDQNITGRFSLREPLAFGTLIRVSFDTAEVAQVVEMADDIPLPASENDPH